MYPNWKLIKQTKTKLKETNKQTNPSRAFLGGLLIPLYHSTKCSITGHGRFSRTKALPSSSQTCKVPYVNVTEFRVYPLLFQFTWHLCPECAHICLRSHGIFAQSVPTFALGHLKSLPRVCPLLFKVTWHLCLECTHFCFRSPGIFARSVPTFVLVSLITIDVIDVCQVFKLSIFKTALPFLSSSMLSLDPSLS